MRLQASRREAARVLQDDFCSSPVPGTGWLRGGFVAGPQGSKAPSWLCSSRRGELSGSCIKGGCAELNKQCKRSEYKQDAKHKQEHLGTEHGAARHGELALPPASAAGLSVHVSEDTTGGRGRSSQRCCVHILEPAVGIKRQGYVKPPHSSVGSVLWSSSASQGNPAHNRTWKPSGDKMQMFGEFCS